MPDKNFRVIILNTLGPKNADRQCKGVKKTMHARIEKLKNEVARTHKNAPKRNSGAGGHNDESEELKGERQQRGSTSGRGFSEAKSRSHPVRGPKRNKHEGSLQGARGRMERNSAQTAGTPDWKRGSGAGSGSEHTQRLRAARTSGETWTSKFTSLKNARTSAHMLFSKTYEDYTQRFRTKENLKGSERQNVRIGKGPREVTSGVLAASLRARRRQGGKTVKRPEGNGNPEDFSP